MKFKKYLMEEDEYKKFFEKMLKKYGVDEPDKIPEGKRKAFYDEVDAKWKGKKEKPEANEAVKTAMKCIECGKAFKKSIGPKTFEVKCPKCGSTDTEVEGY